MIGTISDGERSALSETGYFVRHGVDVGSATAHMFALAYALGQPYAHFPHIMEIRPEAGRAPVSSGGTARFPPHTDHAWHPVPPRFIIMCCLAPGAAGSGLPTVSDASVLTALTAEERQVLQERVVWFPPPPSTGWAGHHGRVLEPPVMRISAAMASGADCSAVEKLYAAILQRETPLQISSGTVWVVDNFRCCHGRAEIHEGLSSTRHLLRLYAELAYGVL